MEEKKERENKKQADKPGSEKKGYTAPELTKHGTVEDITKNIGLVGSDGLTGSKLL